MAAGHLNRTACPLRPRGGYAEQPHGERAALASSVVAEHAPNAQFVHDGVFAPGQIGKLAGIL